MINRDHGLDPPRLSPGGPPGGPPHNDPRGPSFSTLLPPHLPLPSAVAAAPSRAQVPILGPLERAIAAARDPSASIRARAHPIQLHSPSAFAAAASPARNAADGEDPPSPPVSPPSPASPSKPRYKRRTKKYNNFNIFFMLERQLLLQSRGGGIDAVEDPIDTSDSVLTRHKALHLPPLCRRYDHLPLTSNWFLELLANQNKKRPHRKSHGLVPFKELAQTVANNYREIDEETQSFVNEVAERLGWHCEEMEAIDAKERAEAEDRDRRRDAAGVVVVGGGLGASLARKEAPAVSVADAAAGAATGSLSRDEASTVQQFMGMKATSLTSAPRAQAHSAHPQAAHSHPMMSHLPDIESERLQLELARAMNARRDSEQRIHLLEEQMTRHTARTSLYRHREAQAQHHAQQQRQQAALQSPMISSSVLRGGMPGGYEHYLASLLAASGGSPPLPSRPLPCLPPEREDPGGRLREMEDALLQEVLTRRLGPPGAPVEAPYPGAHAALRGGHPVPPPRGAHPEAETAARSNEERDEGREADPWAPGEGAARGPADDRPAAARPDEIGFYNDLYPELLAHRHPPAAAAGARDAARDLAFLDGLAPGAALPPPGLAGVVPERAALLGGLAQGGRPPPPRYPGAAGPGGHSYSELLSELAARRGSHHPAVAPHPRHHHGTHPIMGVTPPPTSTASQSASKQDDIAGMLEMMRTTSPKSSQFGLSHDDIVGTLNEMGRNNNARRGEEGGGEEGGGGRKRPKRED